jgi:hypothetical protein
VRKQDVFINLVDVLPEDRSFGNGEMQFMRTKAVAAASANAPAKLWLNDIGEFVNSGLSIGRLPWKF